MKFLTENLEEIWDVQVVAARVVCDTAVEDNTKKVK